MDLVMFVACLGFFHTSEYALVWMFNPNELSRESWLLSTSYCAAMALAVVEYFVESAAVPHWKNQSESLVWAGFLVVVLGEALRKGAILTARANFTHAIQMERRPQHQLVTHGVYSICRHPGYLGWMLWCVGTQVLLRNPACTLIFLVWSWKFFAERIPYEEKILLEMFGRRYRDYAEKTRLWIPLIPSPVLLDPRARIV